MCGDAWNPRVAEPCSELISRAKSLNSLHSRITIRMACTLLWFPSRAPAVKSGTSDPTTETPERLEKEGTEQWPTRSNSAARWVV